MNKFIFILLIISVFNALIINACDRVPHVGYARSGKLRGDGGFKIKLSENTNKYTPGTPYTVSLVSPQNKRFTRFMLTSESKIPREDESPNQHGIFQLFGDALTNFHEECVNTVSEKSTLSKRVIEVIWTAPPAGSGCIILKAMVLEDRNHWYADDGQLSLELCEQTERVTQDECCACDEAKYTMTFEGLWSNVTHPKDFPQSLWLTHFSDIIGGSHEKNFSFWGEGHISTDGFRLLAEWGSIRGLDQELRLKSKYFRSIFKAAGLWYPKVNTNTTSHFKVDRKRPLVSLVSMFGPSPDWVVGVNGLDLCQKDCTWKENIIVDLYPWDAGTDSGISYESPNAETKPRERMYRITTKYPEDPRAPFYEPHKKEMEPMARLFLKREKVIPKSCDDKFLTSQIEFSENTEEVSKPECAVTEWSNWSPCSVTCGKGLRMHTREYVLPAKAQMFQCSRQLVGKEMCVADVPECEGGNGVDDISQEQEEVLEQRPEGICSVTVWGEWSPCSVSCGKGFKMRRRHFLDRMGPKKCFDVSLVEKDVCMVSTQCTGPSEPVDTECPVTEWTDWSPCTVSCGPNQGVVVRTRYLLVPPEKQRQCAARTEVYQTSPCGGNPCPKLTENDAKEICMLPPENGPCRGTLTRWYFEPKKLMCVPFQYGGCRGNRNNFETADECNNLCQNLRNTLTADVTGDENQPIDCQVSQWSPWSACSVTCGIGRSQQTRTILEHPRNGGVACPKRLVKYRRCNRPSCNN